MQLRRLTALLVFALGWLPLVAVADIRFEATIDKHKIAIDETVNLHILLECGEKTPPPPILPTLEDFDVYSAGRTQNFQMINGKVKSTIRYDYTLSPRKQ